MAKNRSPDRSQGLPANVGRNVGQYGLVGRDGLVVVVEHGQEVVAADPSLETPVEKGSRIKEIFVQVPSVVSNCQLARTLSQSSIEFLSIEKRFFVVEQNSASHLSVQLLEFRFFDFRIDLERRRNVFLGVARPLHSLLTVAEMRKWSKLRKTFY